MKKILAGALLFIAACNQPAETNETKASVPMMPPTKDSAKAALKMLTFDSKTDLVCGMPVRAGVADTLHYKGKLYGFCAPECKEEFLKDPKQFLTLNDKK